MNTRSIDTPWEDMGTVYFDGDEECLVENLDTKEIFRFGCSCYSLLDVFDKSINKFSIFLFNYFIDGSFELRHNNYISIKFRLFNRKLANGASVISNFGGEAVSVAWYHNGSFVKKICQNSRGETVSLIKRNSYGTIVTETFSSKQDSKRKQLLSILGQYAKH